MMMYTRLATTTATRSTRRLLLARTARSFSSNTPDFSDTTRQFSASPATAATTTESPTSNTEGVFDKIAFIGSGMMAQAVMEPMITQNIQPAHKIMVYDVNFSTMQKLSDDHGVLCAESMEELVDESDLIVCAVKPQNLTEAFFAEVRKGTERSTAKDPIFLSVIAGKSMEVFQQGSGCSKIVRSMPNTPATIGQGMTVWSATANLTVEERKKIRQVLSSCGKSMYVDDESYIDMATSISGSGPAYIFMLMEAMVDAGVHMGFPRDKATTLVYHTMLGSTLYAMDSKEHPAILRNRVTSPGGTTASALYELENGRFRTVIKDAMWACFRRSLEMGNHDSNVGPGRTINHDPLTVRLQTDSDEEDGDVSDFSATRK